MLNRYISSSRYIQSIENIIERLSELPLYLWESNGHGSVSVLHDLEENLMVKFPSDLETFLLYSLGGRLVDPAKGLVLEIYDLVKSQSEYFLVSGKFHNKVVFGSDGVGNVYYYKKKHNHKELLENIYMTSIIDEQPSESHVCESFSEFLSFILNGKEF